MDPAPAAPSAGGEDPSSSSSAPAPSASASASASASGSDAGAAASSSVPEEELPAAAAVEEAQPLAQQPPPPATAVGAGVGGLSRYESQKRRDWNTFLQYLRNHRPPLTLARCSGAHVIEFLKYLDQFGKTKVHADGCAFFGQPQPPAPCACPLRQAWGSLDALIGRLRAAYEESGGRPESNPFAARAVRIYLREVREAQAKARGIPYEKKKRKRTTAATTSSPPPPLPPSEAAGPSSAAAGQEEAPPPPQSPKAEKETETETEAKPPPT